MIRHHRDSVIPERDRRRAQDDRLVEDVRQDITRRVDRQYLLRVLSRETIIRIIETLEDSGYVDDVAAGLDHEQLRYWVSDLCDLDYNPGAGDRHYPFRRRELKAVDYVLDETGLEADGEIETENPPLAETRLGNVPPTAGGGD